MNSGAELLVAPLKSMLPETPNGTMPRMVVCECDVCKPTGCTFLVPGQFDARIKGIKMCPNEDKKPKIRVVYRLGIAPDTWKDNGEEPIPVPIPINTEVQ